MVSGSGGSYTGYMGVDHYELEESADDSGIDINAGLALLIGKRATIELSGFYRHLPEESVSEYSFDSLLADGAEVSRLEDTTQFTTPLRSALGAALGAEVYLDDVPVTLGLFFQQSLRRTETEEEPISGREYNCYGFTLGSGLGRGKLATRFGLRYSLAQGERVGWDIGMQNRAWATTAELRDLRRHLVLAVMSGTISFGEDMGGAL
jgi:hypothetical protein